MSSLSRGRRVRPVVAIAAAALSLGAFATSASASGPTPGYPEPAPAVPYAPAAPSPRGWDSAYMGFELGYACCGRDRVQLAPAPPGVIGTMHPSGAFGGLFAGRNWQNGRTVYGIEANLRIGSIDDSLAVGTATSSVRIIPDLQFRGRIGWAQGDSMLYAVGGVAAGRIRYQAGDTAAGSDIRSLYWDPGLTVGVGYERMLGDGNWTMRGEYSYTIFRGTDLTDGIQTTRATPDYHAISFGLARRY